MNILCAIEIHDWIYFTLDDTESCRSIFRGCQRCGCGEFLGQDLRETWNNLNVVKQKV